MDKSMLTGLIVGAAVATGGGVMAGLHKVIGYDVTYRLGDKEVTERMDQRPGDRIPFENGQLVLGQLQ